MPLVWVISPRIVEDNTHRSYVSTLEDPGRTPYILEARIEAGWARVANGVTLNVTGSNTTDASLTFNFEVVHPGNKIEARESRKGAENVLIGRFNVGSVMDIGHGLTVEAVGTLVTGDRFGFDASRRVEVHKNYRCGNFIRADKPYCLTCVSGEDLSAVYADPQCVVVSPEYESFTGYLLKTPWELNLPVEERDQIRNTLKGFGDRADSEMQLELRNDRPFSEWFDAMGVDFWANPNSYHVWSR